MGELFVIVSARKTRKEHRYITLWRANRRGYAWPLPWAGHYDHAEIVEGRFDSDKEDFAVPLPAVACLAEEPRPGDIDGDIGPVIANTPANWQAIRQAARPSPPDNQER